MNFFDFFAFTPNTNEKSFLVSHDKYTKYHFLSLDYNKYVRYMA